MTKKPETAGFVLRVGDARRQSFRFCHPLGGGASEVVMTMLGRSAGLKRLGVNIGRVPAGKEAFVYHRHHAEEEWIYILEGEALSNIEGATEKVTAGDFIAYPAGVAHNLTNIGSADLLYLMGGEQTAVEVADFPRHGKRLARAGERMEIFPEASAKAMIPEIRPVDSKD
jgi:uncharacterized cupin superfamily protein